ncbi:MAG: hypothetical protein QOJ00_2250 [Actinomycetota bacterium]|jgi:uncharacterized protein YcfJ
MNPLRKAIVGGALVASTLAGGAIGAALVNGSASAATTATTAAASDGASSTAARPTPDPTKATHVANNITETLLTGSDADKAKAAALAAVPGGTIQRVETDAEGDAYEAHMLDASGNPVTVKMDSSFKVTRTDTGGPGGGHGRP